MKLPVREFDAVVIGAGGAGMTACFVMGREAGRQAAARAKELKAAA